MRTCFSRGGYALAKLLYRLAIFLWRVQVWTEALVVIREQEMAAIDFLLESKKTGAQAVPQFQLGRVLSMQAMLVTRGSLLAPHQIVRGPQH